MSKQKLEIEIGSGNLKGSGASGKRENYSYIVPREAVAVCIRQKDKSGGSLNLGRGNGKVTLDWKEGDTEAHVHAWVNGSILGKKNEVTWSVVAILIK